MSRAIVVTNYLTGKLNVCCSHNLASDCLGSENATFRVIEVHKAISRQAIV